MTKEKLFEIADDLLTSNVEPDMEVDLQDQVAAVFTDVTEDGKCLVVYQNVLNGDLENVEMFDTTEDAEAHLNAAQQEIYSHESDWD